MKEPPAICSHTIYGWVASSQIQCQLFCLVINIIAMKNNLNTRFYTIFTVLKLDLVIQSLLLHVDYILALEKYAYALRASCFYIDIFLNIFKTKYTTKSTSVSLDWFALHLKFGSVYI